MEDTYENYITDLIRNRKEKIIACTGIENYKLCVETIFNNSIFNVRWVIWNEERFNQIMDRKIMDSIDKFLSQGGKLYIYIGDAKENGEFIKYIRKLMNKYDEQIVESYKGLKLTIKMKGIFRDSISPVEFITFDDVGYRVSNEADKAIGIFCAYSKEYVYQLNNKWIKIPKQKENNKMSGKCECNCGCNKEKTNYTVSNNGSATSLPVDNKEEKVITINADMESNIFIVNEDKINDNIIISAD